jgi:hypothetical protein
MVSLLALLLAAASCFCLRSNASALEYKKSGNSAGARTAFRATLIS